MKSGLAANDRYLPWSDARLFAIDSFSASGPKHSKHVYQLELAGQHEVISWLDSMQTVPVETTFSKPTLTNEEYARQLDALRSVIVAKTGLPLSDLSK
ncbi:hypothetical protein KDA_05340 [Dictyobacter alpinus]|uniref:Uncharacterized protein n=2 Tax=Dictyobacter alpinus TaxID=2014873 RepID=A0A402B117_9CHLR|nr:hypothetical protein KDA_05340 [Dictyobacter alpinus]